MEIKNVAIIGLGLIGGSLGLALKKANGSDVEVVGYSRRTETVSKAKERGIIDTPASSLESAVSGANLVVIATPVLKIKEILNNISGHIDSYCIITDVGSTKAEVVSYADECLPPGISFIGGHPMAGKETSGIEGAEGDLFRDCVYCITPSSKASQEAVEAVIGLIESVGAVPMYIDADLHDSLVAGVSHLPIVLSAAFMSATANNPNWSDMAKLAASGYRDISRLASGSPEMNKDICVTNKGAIVGWIDRYIEELKQYRGFIVEDSDKLINALSQAKDARERWLREEKG